MSSRTQALARAAEAVARREAERIEREKRLQSTLADIFHAQGEAERIRAQAVIAAAPFEDTIREAVRVLEGLGETRTGIAELTGLSLPRVRQYLAGSAATCPAASDVVVDEAGAQP